MTHDDLRDLLHEQVADVTAPDLSGLAWREGRRLRRRRTTAVVGATAAATVAVVGGVTLLGGDRPDRTPAGPATSTPTSTPLPSTPAAQGTRPDGRLDGAPVFWSPSVAQEDALPVMSRGRPPLPEVIDLAAEATSVESDPIDRAEAAFAVSDDAGLQRLLLVTADGGYRTLDVSRLGAVTHADGYRGPATGDSMLSPTGTFLQFPQDGAVMVYDLGASEWRRIGTGQDVTEFTTWANDTQVYLRPTATGGEGPVYDVESGRPSGRMRLDAPHGGLDLGERATPYGRYRLGALGDVQSWYADVSLDLPEGRVQGPEVLVTSAGPAVLAFTDAPARWKACCPVAGWVEEQVVAYESRRAEPRLVAWWVGSHRFETVSRIVGFTPGEQAFVSSYARWWM